MTSSKHCRPRVKFKAASAFRFANTDESYRTTVRLEGPGLINTWLHDFRGGLYTAASPSDRGELDPVDYPSEEVFRPTQGKRRNTRQEMAHHRFRQMTSWSFWSQMKSSTGIKLAAVGALVAALLQAAPLLQGSGVAVVPLSWLFSVLAST